MALFASRPRATHDPLEAMSIPEAPFRQLRATTRQGILVLAVSAAHLLDDDAVESLARELRAAVTRSGARAVALDLGAVRAPGAAACETLVALNDLVRQRGGRLLLCGLGEHVAELLRLTGVLAGPVAPAAPLKAVPDVEAAVARLGARVRRT